ncbi:ABC transporter ATP-binding protein [Actinomadura rugatobispora]|uniref:ABC transporter ATP-binding protein n=1 Tax=Actinomadura rugatobispora TaxID=1994 RepID=A0ABW0ZUZ2_9ACTN|nr:ABC transporter ATP-binding protein [Actinomadura rugatobispora]
MSPPLMEVRDLRLRYRTGRGMVHAVDGVSLTVERGETLGLVGESGCGKTAFARAVTGLVPGNDAQRSGSVLFAGEDLLALDDEAMRSVLGTRIAMVFQSPLTSLNPVMRIGAQLTEGLRLHRSLSRAAARAAAADLLRSVHIADPEAMLRRYPHQLSGGMRQRVIIAIALACGPELLLADEPTTALDVTVQAQILDLLAELRRERGMATVLVSHDLGVVATRTDRIAVMYAGKIVEYGPTRALFRRPRMPYTEALLGAIPRLDAEDRGPLRTIPGSPPSLLDPGPGCRFAPRCAHAGPRCLAEEPPLREAGTPGHRFACWHPIGTEP